MGINASQLRSSNVESWSPEDVGSFLGSLGGEEFEAAKLACVKRGVNGQESDMSSDLLLLFGITCP